MFLNIKILIDKTSKTIPLIGAGMVFTMITIFPASANEAAKLSIVYNNVPFNEALTTSWGFSCFIKRNDRGILFDTGGSGDILLSNMEKLGIRPEQVDLIVLSHIHGDHTGGLGSFLSRNSKVSIYVPQSFPQAFKNDLYKSKTNLVSVSGPIEICERVYIGGEMGTEIREQCLILKTKKGLVIITGCAHPGIVNMARHAKEWLKADIYLALGGFHLMGYDEDGVNALTRR